MGIEQELRLGNYLNHSELGIVEVVGVGKEYIHCISNGQTHYESIRSFSPIPLTEEILKKLGQFVCFHGDYKMYKIKEISVLVNGYDNNIIKVAETIIKSIHHLQNIIFDLMGEELTI